MFCYLIVAGVVALRKAREHGIHDLPELLVSAQFEKLLQFVYEHDDLGAMCLGPTSQDSVLDNLQIITIA